MENHYCIYNGYKNVGEWLCNGYLEILLKFYMVLVDHIKEKSLKDGKRKGNEEKLNKKKINEK